MRVAESSTLPRAYELVGEEKDGLEGELAVAEVEEVFERRSEKIEHHGVVVALHSEPPHKRHSNTTGERLVDLGLILELRVLGLDRLELDGDLLAGDNVDTEVDVTCSSLANEEARSAPCASSDTDTAAHAPSALASRGSTPTLGRKKTASSPNCRRAGASSQQRKAPRSLRQRR